MFGLPGTVTQRMDRLVGSLSGGEGDCRKRAQPWEIADLRRQEHIVAQGQGHIAHANAEITQITRSSMGLDHWQDCTRLAGATESKRGGEILRDDSLPTREGAVLARGVEGATIASGAQLHHRGEVLVHGETRRGHDRAARAAGLCSSLASTGDHREHRQERGKTNRSWDLHGGDGLIGESSRECEAELPLSRHEEIEGQAARAGNDDVRGLGRKRRVKRGARRRNPPTRTTSIEAPSTRTRWVGALELGRGNTMARGEIQTRRQSASAVQRPRCEKYSHPLTHDPVLIVAVLQVEAVAHLQSVRRRNTAIFTQGG